jgi:spore germination cell wall hydrolase CwlJ-like protein
LPYQYLRSLGGAALCVVLLGLTSFPALAIDPDRLAQRESPKGLPSNELTCLAEAVYFEARGEPDSGQRAVAQVVVNRAGSGAYPRSICGVVYQNQHRRNACQFSFACDGMPETKSEEAAWRKAKRIALQIASGEMQAPVLRTATHYHASYVQPSWAKKMTRLSKIGLHVFYREDL